MTSKKERPADGTPVTVDPRHPRAELVDRLVVQDDLGQGGIASIKVALDRNLRRESALKALQSQLADSASTIGRLIEEAQIMAQLEHPGIVPVHELSEDAEGNVFFTMKLVKGRTLREILYQQDYRQRDDGALYDQLQIFLKVCDAVSFAHSRGVIHRDLKADNIMVGEYGEVYVMDWGIARLKNRRPSELDRQMPDTTQLRYEVGDEDGLIIGTPGFMAPEQARGDIESVDERTDVFSLGAILYHILTQAPPYFGRNSQEMVVNTLTQQVVPPQDRVHLDLPPEICRIAMKALRQEPEQRYPNVSDLKGEVESFLQSTWQLERREFEAGELVVKEGDVGDEAFIITRGRCEAFKTVDGTDMGLREMVEGDVFGETAVLTDQTRTASVKALEPLTVFVVSREQLQQEMGMGYLVGRFMKALAERFKERDEHATHASREAERFELATSILKYLNFSGATVGDDRREAKWSTMREVLSSYFKIPSEEVAAMVANLGFLTIDEKRDVIVLRRTG